MGQGLMGCGSVVCVISYTVVPDTVQHFFNPLKKSRNMRGKGHDHGPQSGSS